MSWKVIVKIMQKYGEAFSQLIMCYTFMEILNLGLLLYTYTCSTVHTPVYQTDK